MTVGGAVDIVKTEANTDVRANVGLELGVYETAFLRGGARHSHGHGHGYDFWTAGVGLAWGHGKFRIRLDYAAFEADIPNETANSFSTTALFDLQAIKPSVHEVHRV